MKTRFIFTVIAVLFSFSTWAGGEGNKLGALMDTARSQGSVRVIVQLDLGLRGSAELSEQAEADLIRSTSQALLASSGIEPLVGINITNVVEYDFIPFMAAEVDPVGLQALSQHPLVVEIGEDGQNQPFLKQSVPKIMGVSNPWTAPPSGATGQGKYVAIIDTGIERTHQMFAGKAIREACYKATTNCPNGQKSQVGVGAARPVHYHGTHVAGIAAGRYMSSRGFGGVAHKSNIVAINVFETSPITAYDSSIVKGLNHVYSLRGSLPIASVNLSLGASVYHSTTCDNTSTAHKAYYAAAEKLKKRRVATVFATGNDYYSGGIASPACVSNVIGVGNSTKWDGMSPSTNNGLIMDVFAPGHKILSAVPGNKFAYLTGTSMAAPHIAGVFALLMQKYPTASVTALRTAIQASGKDIMDNRNGAKYLWAPRVQVKEALKNVGAYKSAAVGFNTTSSLNRFQKHSGNWFVQSSWGGANGAARSFGRAGYRNYLQLHHNYLNGSVAAKMKRLLHSSHNNSANTLHARVTGPTVDSPFKNGYYFQYTNSGSVSVYKLIDGKLTVIKNWTLEPKVNKGGWNTLLITTGGKYAKFYINGKLVAQHAEPKLIYGRPAVSFWRGSGTPSTSYGADWIYSKRGPNNPITYYGASADETAVPFLNSVSFEDSESGQGASATVSPACLNSPDYCQ